MKPWLLLALLTCCFSSMAKAKMIAEHGFAIVNDGGSIFLSYIPKYEKNRRVQLVYEMEVLPTHLAFSQLIRAESIVTFKPKEAFDLKPLVDGLPMRLIGDVYAGHYQHGGWAVYRDFEIHLETQKYVRKFDDKEKPLEAASNLQTYDVVPLARDHRLWIHRVQQKPSYDHLLLTIDDVACPQQIMTTSSVPTEAEVYRRLSSCGSLKPLYYSAHDLQ
jgi:hypothetical protein